jgi:hypothetical protein
MSSIANFPTNVLSVTPEIYANKLIKKLWGSPVLRMFTLNEIQADMEAKAYGDFITAKFKPIVTAEVITNAASAIGAYQDLNYGKVQTQLDFVMQTRYSVKTLNITANSSLEYDLDGAEASADAIVMQYETEVFNRIRTSPAIPPAQVLGTVGTILNKKVFDAVRADTDLKRQKGKVLLAFLTPDKYIEAQNITEFMTLTNRNGALVDAEVKRLGLDEQDYFVIPGNLNMIVIKMFNWTRPVPASDPFGFCCFADSILTPIRPVAPSKTGAVKILGNIAVTHTVLPDQDARIGVATNIKDEFVGGFSLVPWDISVAGVASGTTVYLIRGGI